MHNRSGWWRVAALSMIVALFAAAGFAAVAGAAPFAGGGPMAVYQTLSTPELKAAFARDGLGTPPSSMFLFGGGGYGPLVGSNGDFTVGGFGMGGEQRWAAGGRNVVFAMGMGGPRLGYQANLVNRLSLDAGLALGFGGASVTVLHKQPTSFDLSQAGAYKTDFNRFILALVPDVNLSLALTPLVHLQVGAAYLFDTRINGEWKSSSGTVLASAPNDPLGGVQGRLALVFGPDWSHREAD